MTSIAEPARGVRASVWLRAVLLVLTLGLLALQTAPPWAVLWLAVPAAAAVSLIAAWRFGLVSLVLPAVLAVVAIVVGGPLGLWAWWMPAAALSGAWMGLSQERAPGRGDLAWMLAPVLALAALLPWMPGYPQLVDRVDREARMGDAEFLAFSKRIGYDSAQWETLKKSLDEAAVMRTKAMPSALPTMLFLWMAVLVGAGRTLSSGVVRVLRWPPMPRAALRDFRLPDAAIWVFLAGLAVLLIEWPAAMPTGWTLLINAGLGFCIQGIAVVESLLLARGMPPSIIALLLVFVFTVAMPLFTVTTAALGLSDVWLDYRRLEPAADDDQS